jgi:hypothetical protein
MTAEKASALIERHVSLSVRMGISLDFTLNSLAWMFAVDNWDTRWPEETKRQAIFAALTSRRH